MGGGGVRGKLGRSAVVEVKSEVQVQFRTDYLMSPKARLRVARAQAAGRPCRCCRKKPRSSVSGRQGFLQVPHGKVLAKAEADRECATRSQSCQFITSSPHATLSLVNGGQTKKTIPLPSSYIATAATCDASNCCRHRILPFLSFLLRLFLVHNVCIGSSSR